MSVEIPLFAFNVCHEGNCNKGTSKDVAAGSWQMADDSLGTAQGPEREGEWEGQKFKFISRRTEIKLRPTAKS
ncbi:hypothetical protein ACLKA7_016579 [Drosophila subpalustris]